MEYTVNISDNAASELEGAVAYIAERFAAPHAMASLLAAYDMAIDALPSNAISCAIQLLKKPMRFASIRFYICSKMHQNGS